MKIKLLGLIPKTPKQLKKEIEREGISFPRTEEVYQQNGAIFVKLPEVGDVSTFWFEKHELQS